MKKIPVVKTIYNSLHDLFMFFDKNAQNKQRAVIVKTPIGKVIGFVTKDNLEQFPEELQGKDAVLVYVPFGFQIGGFTMIIERKDLVDLNMPVEKAMSLVVTAGMASGSNNTINK